MVLVPSPLPPEGRRFVRILSPSVGKPIRFVSLSTVVTGVLTHFVNGRTQPCLPQACPFCPPVIGYPQRWKGYLFGRDVEGHVAALLELPADTCRTHVQLRDQSINLAGASILAERIGPAPNSTVRATVRLDAVTRVRPAQEPDILRHLSRIWGIADIDERASIDPEVDA